jgi:hypothetical protein
MSSSSLGSPKQPVLGDGPWLAWGAQQCAAADRYVVGGMADGLASSLESYHAGDSGVGGFIAASSDGDRVNSSDSGSDDVDRLLEASDPSPLPWFEGSLGGGTVGAAQCRAVVCDDIEQLDVETASDDDGEDISGAPMQGVRLVSSPTNTCKGVGGKRWPRLMLTLTPVRARVCGGCCRRRLQVGAGGGGAEGAWAVAASALRANSDRSLRSIGRSGAGGDGAAGSLKHASAAARRAAADASSASASASASAAAAASAVASSSSLAAERERRARAAEARLLGGGSEGGGGAGADLSAAQRVLLAAGAAGAAPLSPARQRLQLQAERDRLRAAEGQERAAVAARVSHFLAWIGSLCLRRCVHGASIGGGGGAPEAGAGERGRPGQSVRQTHTHGFQVDWHTVRHTALAWQLSRACSRGEAGPRRALHTCCWRRYTPT